MAETKSDLYNTAKTILTSAETVARIQNYFGVYRIEEDKPTKTETNGHSITNGGDNHYVTSTKIRNAIVTSVSECLQHDKCYNQANGNSSDKADHHQTHVNYRVENYLWYYLFQFGAFLGDDLFYYTFMPFWFFNINLHVIRRVILIWGVFMYIGQSSKEVRLYCIGCMLFFRIWRGWGSMVCTGHAANM